MHCRFSLKDCNDVSARMQQWRRDGIYSDVKQLIRNCIGARKRLFCWIKANSASPNVIFEVQELFPTAHFAHTAIPSYPRRPSSPRKREENVRFPTTSGWGLSLREANVYVSAKGAPHDGQDTVKTLRTIIWYKRACIRQTTWRLSIAVQTSKKDVNKSVVIEQFLN